MTKYRLAAALGLLLVSFLSSEGTSEAWPVDPWCQEDYLYCIESGEDWSVCACYREMCMGRDCP